MIMTYLSQLIIIVNC